MCRYATGRVLIARPIDARVQGRRSRHSGRATLSASRRAAEDTSVIRTPDAMPEPEDAAAGDASGGVGRPFPLLRVVRAERPEALCFDVEKPGFPGDSMGMHPPRRRPDEPVRSRPQPRKRQRTGEPSTSPTAGSLACERAAPARSLAILPLPLTCLLTCRAAQRRPRLCSRRRRNQGGDRAFRSSRTAAAQRLSRCVLPGGRECCCLPQRPAQRCWWLCKGCRALGH